MRLSKEQIDRISRLIIHNLKDKELITLKAEEEKITNRIKELITKNLLEEDELDKEVEGILKAYSSEIEKQGADYRKMFKMVKSKLARERKFIL